MPAVTAAAVRSTSPAIQRLTVSSTRLGIEALLAHALVHLGEARRVPQLGREVAIALDARWCDSLMSRPCAAMAASVKRSASAPYSSIMRQGVHDVALGLRHLLPLLVAHQGVDVDVVERHLLHEVEAHHHHARDPEEDDVEAGDERAGRIVALQLRVLSGQPSVENGHSAEENQVSSTSASRLRSLLAARIEREIVDLSMYGDLLCGAA